MKNEPHEILNFFFWVSLSIVWGVEETYNIEGYPDCKSCHKMQSKRVQSGPSDWIPESSLYQRVVSAVCPDRVQYVTVETGEQVQSKRAESTPDRSLFDRHVDVSRVPF